MFITLEGPEGSGKSANLRWIAEQFRARGSQVLTTREPGGTPVGEKVRTWLMSDHVQHALQTSLLLFNAARAELVATVIVPALQAGTIVVCDRFTDSTLAYQGYGDGLALGEVRAVNTVATGGLVPDRTLLLDIDVEAGLKRKRGGADWNALDDRPLAYHRAVRAGFLALAAAEPERWCIIDASKPLPQVQADIARCLFVDMVYDAGVTRQ